MQEDEELLLCRRYMRLKNDHDPSADQLLAPSPAVPIDPIAPQEADGFDAASFLRGDLSVRDVRRVSSGRNNQRFLLLTKGAGAGPLLHVRSGDKVDRLQRVMTNPAIVVEVHDGKIYPIRPEAAPD